MLSLNLNIAEDKQNSSVELGYDVAAKYYTITKTDTIIVKGELHIEANKRLVMTVEQAEKLRDDLNGLFGIHNKKKF